jgi:NAD(P)-dependent dehydrogenase (short-subunit alcohol dehydrogenase family)
MTGTSAGRGRRVGMVSGANRGIGLEVVGQLAELGCAELRETGILVNSVCPGWVATDMGGERAGRWRKVRQVSCGQRPYLRMDLQEDSSATVSRCRGSLDHPIRSDTGPARIGLPSVSTAPVTLYFPALTRRPARPR